MTDDEILEMAIDSMPLDSGNAVIDFARLVEARTREECARICDTHTVDDVLVGVGIAQSCADAIRGSK